VLERRDSVVADVGVFDEQVSLFFDGHRLDFPKEVEQDIEFMVETDETFRPLDLPGQLDDESRLVLVRRLVREGFLSISEAERGDGSRGSDGRAAE
jgi:hypothetical protein